MYVVKILRTCVSHIFFSGLLSRAAKVLIPNPLLSLSKQMNSWSFVDKSQFLPEAAFSISGESLQFQKLMEFKGETLSRKLCSTSNWADVRPTKCFIRVESFTMFSYDRLLTTLGAWGLEMATSFLKIIVSTFAESVYLQNTVCELWSTTIFPVAGFLYSLGTTWLWRLSVSSALVELLVKVASIKDWSASSIGLKSFDSSPQSFSTGETFFVTGSDRDFGAFLLGARAWLSCAGVRFAFRGSGCSSVGPFSPGQWRAHM